MAVHQQRVVVDDTGIEFRYESFRCPEGPALAVGELHRPAGAAGRPPELVEGRGSHTALRTQPAEKMDAHFGCTSRGRATVPDCG
ncbi:hypothetical protein [Escherichia coli]|uniref:hypothetical protein n=1 Tax=Escherichia coli TaxID=562 RepID=UPI003890843D